MKVIIRVARMNRRENWACRRRGVTPPLATSPTPWTTLLALAMPRSWRRFHHRYATTHGYYWLPCPACGREYGGHEDGGSELKPNGGGLYRSVCIECTKAHPERYDRSRVDA